MAATGLKERDIVRHRTYGIGRVKAIGDDAIVIDFQGRPRPTNVKVDGP